MALSESGNLQSNKLQRGPSLRLELELTPPKDSAPNIAARDSAAIEAGSTGDHDPRGHVTGQPASPLNLKYFCKHCRRPIIRDLDYELHLPAEGQRWYHDDFVDGAEDAPCTGVSCQNETDEREATEAEPGFPDSFYRPRFIVLPTGRTMLAWGIWDCQKNPLGSLPTCIFKMSDFVHRTRSLGKAYAFARRLNEKHERKAAA